MSRTRAKLLNKRLLSYAALPAAAALAPVNADAAFIGPYDPSLWTFVTGGDGSVDTSGAPNSVEITGSDSGLTGPIFTDFTIAAVQTGSVTFDWSWINTDSSSIYDFGSFLLNGTPTNLTGSAFSNSGSFSIAVNNGDVFGFRVRATDDQLGPGILTISNFNAPGQSEVPEPSSLALLALGAAGVLAVRRRRNQG